MAKPRTPLKVLKNQGTYQKCRHEDRRDLELPVGMPEKPDFLDKEAAKEWDKITPLLLEHGVISEIDGAALTHYCVLYGRFVLAVKSDPSSFTPAKSAALRNAFTDLGMSPAARTKIPGSGKDPKPENPFSKKPKKGNKAG